MEKQQSPVTDLNKRVYKKKLRELRVVKANLNRSRTFVEKFADYITAMFGSTLFLVSNFVWFVFWICANEGLIPGVPVFDPFPYGLLTMVVSLEAIFLSIFVLMSQNRASDIDDIREEVGLQVNIKSEQEITKILVLLDAMSEKLGIDTSQDKVLHKMEHVLPTSTILRNIRAQLKKNR